MAEESAATTANGVDIVKAWKSTYNDSSKNDETMEQFWKIYDPEATSVWTMVYDEADSNETLPETIELVDNFFKQNASIQDECFGVVHTLESLEIEGIWFFNGPDPEKMFGANEETSWYSWAQLGPSATDPVKAAVAKLMAPADGKLNGKAIKDTKVFV